MALAMASTPPILSQRHASAWPSTARVIAINRSFPWGLPQESRGQALEPHARRKSTKGPLASRPSASAFHESLASDHHPSEGRYHDTAPHWHILAISTDRRATQVQHSSPPFPSSVIGGAVPIPSNEPSTSPYLFQQLAFLTLRVASHARSRHLG